MNGLRIFYKKQRVMTQKGVSLIKKEVDAKLSYFDTI